MVFRADEAAEALLAKTRRYLIGPSLPPEMRSAAEEAVTFIVGKCGPAVEAYPSWHPLVSNHDPRHPAIVPSERCGYERLDHTRHFVNGFVTCPYGDGKEVIKSVERLPVHPCGEFVAEPLEATLYNSGTTAILVRFEWNNRLDPGHQIPKSLAVPLMLEQEIPCWRWATRPETWERMRPYLLGEPHGNRSSLFVSQETAIAMKKLYEGMVDSGMFGANG